MKNILKNTSLIIIGLIIGLTIQFKSGNQNTYTKESFKITNTLVSPSGNNILEFSDGSYACINVDKGLYSFTPSELVDWDNVVDNKDQLINMIKTYMLEKYKMNVEDVEKDVIFKNENLMEV